MLKQYVHRPRSQSPFREVGEIIWGRFGNYLEAGAACRPKGRPGIILAPHNCQHFVVGLTTKAVCKISGEPRVEIPSPQELGLDDQRSFLWSPRPSRLCRLDVREHKGWITAEVVELLHDHAYVDQAVLSRLWSVACRRHALPK